MKKILILLLLAATTGYSSIAEAKSFTSKVLIGAGATMLNIDGDTVSDEAKIGYLVGYQGTQPMGDRHSFSFGIEYQTINSDYTKTVLGSDIDYDVQTSWIQVPLLYHFEMMPHVNFYGGAFAARKIDESVKVSDVTIDTTELKNTNFGLIAGLSYRVSKRTDIMVQYDFGLRDLSNDNDFDIHTSALRAVIGVSF